MVASIVVVLEWDRVSEFEFRARVRDFDGERLSVVSAERLTVTDVDRDSDRAIVAVSDEETVFVMDPEEVRPEADRGIDELSEGVLECEWQT